VPLPPDLPVVDHHCHLHPSGEAIGAVRRFRAAGGTHLFLATQNYRPGPIVRLDTYREQFATTIDLAARIRSETGVVVHVVLAPFPVDLLAAAERIGLPAAADLHRAALDAASVAVADQRAVALGEVGWPHFPVPDDVGAAAASVFDHALGRARDVGCPVVVHSDDLDATGYARLAASAARAGLPPGRVVKHYARSIVDPVHRRGIVPSFLARKDLAATSLADPGPWFWETDFLDDPARPGAVLDLATVPRRARAWVEGGGDPDRLRIPFIDSVAAVYGFTPTTSPSGAG